MSCLFSPFLLPFPLISPPPRRSPFTQVRRHVYSLSPSCQPHPTSPSVTQRATPLEPMLGADSTTISPLIPSDLSPNPASLPAQACSHPCLRQPPKSFSFLSPRSRFRRSSFLADLSLFSSHILVERPSSSYYPRPNPPLMRSPPFKPSQGLPPAGDAFL